MYEVRVLSADLKSQVEYLAENFNWIPSGGVRLSKAQKRGWNSMNGHTISDPIEVVTINGPVIEINPAQKADAE